MDTLTRSKSMARALRKALADRHVDVSHSACLEIVARQLGFTDWNVLSAACREEMLVGMTIFIEHGRQQEAAAFYEAAFGAARIRTYSHDGELRAFDLRLGDKVISVSGSNPRREAEPSRGGPFFPKENGAVSTIFRLEVDDAEAVLRRAVAAGAIIRDKLQSTAEGRRVTSFFDPFGHIWGIEETEPAAKRRAA